MSLLLRQRTQEALNNIGLTSFHTQINNNKTLEIVTRCGKPFITIFGIKFNKSQLTNQEIEFASELFEQFLNINKTKIEAYISAYTHFHSLDVIESVFDNLSCKYYSNNNIKIWQVTIQSKNFYNIYLLNNTFEIRSKCFSDSIEELTELMSQENKDRAINYLHQYILYEDERQQLEDIANELAKCDI